MIRNSIRNALLRVADRLSPRDVPLDSAWEVVALPLPPDTSKPYIDVIRGTPTGDVWVLGTAYSRSIGELRFACRSQGDGFELVANTPAGIGVSVSPIGHTDAWFAGRNGTIAHYDGTQWTRHVFERFYFDFVDILARDGSDIWLAAAGSRVVHFDGRRFRVDEPDVLAGSSTHVLWGTGTELLVPVNAEAQPTSVARLGASGTWSHEPLGAGGATLIHGSGASDIWILSRREGGWHFDGEAWTRHATGPGPFWSLHVAAPDHAYAAGDAGALARWDGTRWSTSSITTDRLVSVYRQRDGRLLAGGSQLYRERTPPRP